MISNGLESHRHVAGNLVKPLCIGENSPVRVGPGPVYRWASKQTRTCRKNVFQKCWSGMPYRSDIVYLWACLSPVHHFLWLLPYFIEVRGCHLAFRLFRMKMWDCMIQTTSLHYINALIIIVTYILIRFWKLDVSFVRRLLLLLIRGGWVSGLWFDWVQIVAWSTTGRVCDWKVEPVEPVESGWSCDLGDFVLPTPLCLLWGG